MHYEEKKIVFWDFRGMEIPAIVCAPLKNLGFINASNNTFLLLMICLLNKMTLIFCKHYRILHPSAFSVTKNVFHPASIT